MSYIGGRRKPKAAERSDGLLKKNIAQLNGAEVLVRIFNDTIERVTPKIRLCCRSDCRNG